MRRIGLVALLIGAVTLSGCSSGVDRQASADESAATNELRIAVTVPVQVDPARVVATDVIGVLAADLLFDGLTRSDGGPAEPELAQSWETTDGMTWTFHLDQDRQWSDGSGMTAAPVVASLERVRSLAASSLAGARLGQVREIAAVDDWTVRIVLGAPNRDLPALLADPAYGIVPETANAPQMASDTTTSGRYRVRTGGADAATLVPVDPEAVHLGGIQFVRVDDADAATAALADGTVDIAPLRPGVDPPDGATTVVVSAATLVLEVSTTGEFADPARRAALTGLIDRSAIAAAVAGDEARRADTLVPGGVVAAGPCVTACEPSGAGDVTPLTGFGSDVRLDVPTDLLDDDAAAAVIEQLRAAGVPATLRRTGAAGLATNLTAGGVDLVLFGVVGTAPTPDPYLDAVLGSTGRENLSGHATAEFDDGLAAARDLAEDGARRAKYVELEAVTLAEAPVIPLVTLGSRYAVATRVSGVSPAVGRLFDGAAVRLR